MAIATIDALYAARLDILSRVAAQQVSCSSGQWHTMVAVHGTPGAVAIDSLGLSASGDVPVGGELATPVIPSATGTRYLGAVGCSFGGAATLMLLADRVFVCGSYDYNSGTTNLTSQPSYSSRMPGGSYNGTQIWVEVHTAWASSTASSVTVTYTDQDGNTGASAGAYVLPTAVIAGRAFALNLASGDSGVQKIESVQISTTTGSPTQGGINVSVLRPLFMFGAFNNGEGDIWGIGQVGMPEIHSDACLALMQQAANSSTSMFSMTSGVISG